MGPLPQPPAPLRLLLTGTAGTGKTVVIPETARRVEKQRFILMAPTGNAACAIGGMTIHSGFRILVTNRRSSEPSQMSEGATMELQQRMTGVDFIFVDEFSMVGQEMLGLMSARGKQAVRGRIRGGYHDGHLDVFGGLSIILVGDWAQLPPVGAKSMWNPVPSSTGLSVQGYQAWLAMNNAVELTQVMRQLGPEQAARDTFLRIAEGTQTRSGWILLQQIH
ncbi:unnamed protein product [Pylaiella littoralis]